MRLLLGGHLRANLLLFGPELFDCLAFFVGLDVRLLELVEQFARGLGMSEQINQALKNRQAVGTLVEIIHEAHAVAPVSCAGSLTSRSSSNRCRASRVRS